MGKRKNEYSSCQNDVIDVQVFLMLPQRRRERKDSERGIVCFYFEEEVSPIKNLRHGRRRRKMISDVLRNAKHRCCVESLPSVVVEERRVFNSPHE